MSTSEASSIATTSTLDSKLAVFAQAQPEKPFHYTYLKEFRVEQCPLFLQHKCTQHRPFTCFHWHFMNQRRRRPKKKRDGTFNYSPDVYCTQYDETTGLCPSGDDCPYLHRVAGDVERRYHLRYYKTATCIYETDSRGYCVKNGPHCAFAHGPHDLRQPVYDIRELQALEKEEVNDGAQQAVENKAVVEDPRWHDTNYVLAHYKTESCKKPPRLCRQGYACPHYHNSRDRRRSPRTFRYRSTPCPQVKHGDEWGEPGNCESGDECPYCHTRTEQQFHPEIYKSTKCNDMQQTGHCPRGPFCAFAHVEQEMTSARDIEEQLNNFPPPLGLHEEDDNIPQLPSYPLPIGKPGRSLSTASSTGSFSEVLNTPTSGGSFYKAPGSERSERSSSREEDYQSYLRKQMLAIENDSNLDEQERARRKQSFMNQVSQCGDNLLDIGLLLNCSTSPSTSAPHTPTHSLSASAKHFYPEDTVESVLDDLHLGDFDVSELEKELNEQSSVASSLGGSLPMALSAPVSIPGTTHENSPQSYTPQSPLSPLGGQISSSFGSGHIQLQKQLSNPYRNSPLTVRGNSFSSSILDPLVTSVPLHSPGLHSPLLNSPLSLNPLCTDVQKLQDDLKGAKSKLASWEQSWAQAKQACDAWKKEAEDCADKARVAEEEKAKAVLKKQESETEVSQLKLEMENLSGGPYLHVINKVSTLDSLSLTKLKQIQQQLKTDVERLDKVIYWKQSLHCQICHEQIRCIATLPCSHCVMCESCSSKQSECPYCNAKITQRTTIHIPS